MYKCGVFVPFFTVSTYTEFATSVTPQGVYWTYMGHSEDVQDVFWTPYIHSIHMLCPGGMELSVGTVKILAEMFRSSCTEVFCGKGVLKNFTFSYRTPPVAASECSLLRNKQIAFGLENELISLAMVHGEEDTFLLINLAPSSIKKVD